MRLRFVVVDTRMHKPDCVSDASYETIGGIVHGREAADQVSTKVRPGWNKLFEGDRMWIDILELLPRGNDRVVREGTDRGRAHSEESQVIVSDLQRNRGLYRER